MSYFIYVSKTDPESIANLNKELQDQSQYFFDGKYTNFAPRILCSDCDNAPCVYNPRPLANLTPIAVVCSVCQHVYFHD